MISVVLAVLAAVAAFIGGKVAFGLGSGIFLGLVALLGVYIPLARRVSKAFDGANKEIEAHVTAGRVPKAIERLESLRALGRWQPGVGRVLDAQIGMLKYAQLRDFEGARPYLEAAPGNAHLAKAMLAAHHFKKQRYDEMVAVFEKAVKRSSKEGLLWAAYAYCEWRRNRTTDAIRVLARGRAVLPNDERLKRAAEALQNNKKLKTRTFGNDFLALHLEDLPIAPAGARQGMSLPPHVMARMARGGHRTMRRR